MRAIVRLWFDDDDDGGMEVDDRGPAWTLPLALAAPRGGQNITRIGLCL
jgi:hypothetical protein